MAARSFWGALTDSGLVVSIPSLVSSANLDSLLAGEGEVAIQFTDVDEKK